MIKKYILLVFAASLSFCIHAQDIKFRDCQVIDTSSKKVKNLTYSKTEKSDGKAYYTTYQIYGATKKGVQEVKFIFDKDQKAITVIKKNLITSAISFNYKKYEENYSLYMVKNFEFNDTIIDDTAYYEMLYTVPDTSQPYVQLNSFLVDSSKDYYKIYPMREGYFKMHKDASKNYFKSLAKAELIAKPFPVIDTIAASQLKNKMVGRVYSFVDSLKLAFISQGSIVKQPTDENSRIFKKQINRLIDSYIDELKSTDGGLTSDIFVQVDTLGKVAFSTVGEKAVRDSVDSKKTNPYRKLFKKVFLTDITSERFPVSSAMLTSDPFMHVLYDNTESCKRIDSTLIEFAGTFSLCRTKLHELDSIQTKSPTLYSYKFAYTSSTKEAKWKLTAKGKLTEIAPSEGKVIDSELRSQFMTKLKKRRAGRYFVSMCNFEYNGGEKTTTVDSTRLRYRYFTNIGASVSTFIPVGLPGNFTFNAFEVLGVDFFVTYHHIGFFAGSAIYNASSKPDITYKTNITVLSGTPIYAQTGLFLGTCNYLYFKAGLSILNTDRTIIDQSGASTTSLSNTYIGFTGGISLIFPIVHIEGGFNTIFMSPYASIGLNIPLKR